MQIKFQSVITVLGLCALISCSNGGNDKMKNVESNSYKARADSISASSSQQEVQLKSNAEPNGYKSDTGSFKKDYVSSSAAKEDPKHPERKFVRTAELKFKVKNVIKATYAIEDIIGRNDGYINSTNLSSTIENQTVVPMSEDSSLESTYFNVSNTVLARIPNTKLDSTLKSIALLVDYLDYRIIKADDVALQLRANQLIAARNTNLNRRITHDIDTKGHKLPQLTDAEENATSRQETADNARLANMSLIDQVKYSTVSMVIYQRQEVKKIMVLNEKNTKAFEPGLGRRLASALRTGWGVLEAIIVFFAEIWWFVILVAAGIVLYIRYKTKKKAN